MSIETLQKPLNYEEERGKPMPSNNHGAIQMNLGVEFAKHREFRTFSELTLEINGKPFTPDLSVYSRTPLDLRRDVFRRTNPPLMVVEIFPAPSGRQDVMENINALLAHGVKSCWVVLPPMHSIQMLTADGRETVLHTGVAADPVTGLTADLAAVFS